MKQASVESCSGLGGLDALQVRGLGESRRASFLALRSAQRRAMMRAVRATGMRMANMPSIHHVALRRRPQGDRSNAYIGT
jgi:hypothetical protein